MVKKNYDNDSKIEKIEIRKVFLWNSLNSILINKVTASAHTQTYNKVKDLIEKGYVPKEYRDIELPKKKAQNIPIQMAKLVWCCTIWKDIMKSEGVSHCNLGIDSITPEILSFYDEERFFDNLSETLCVTGDDDVKRYAGNIVPTILELKGYDFHPNSIYRWHWYDKSLPKFSAKKYYNMCDIDQWVSYLESRPGRKPPQHR